MESSSGSLVPPKPSRTFSKRLVVACAVLAWCALFYAIYAGQPTVAVAGFSFIATVVAGYCGIGHLDLRALLSAATARDSYQPDPPPIEMRDTPDANSN